MRLDVEDVDCPQGAAVRSHRNRDVWRSGARARRHVDLDLTDFDDDSMRDMDDANKDLQPVLGAKNAAAALSDAQLIQSVLKETETWFSKKGGTDTAVKIAQDGESIGCRSHCRDRPSGLRCRRRSGAPPRRTAAPVTTSTSRWPSESGHQGTARTNDLRIDPPHL